MAEWRVYYDRGFWFVLRVLVLVQTPFIKSVELHRCVMDTAHPDMVRHDDQIRASLTSNCARRVRQKKIIDAYHKAFPNKMLMARTPRDYAGKQAWLGFHDDL